jgi:hypothetical protein
MSIRKDIIKANNLKTTKLTRFFLPLFGEDFSRYTEHFIGLYINSAINNTFVAIFENKLEESEELRTILYILYNHYSFKNDISGPDENEEIVLEFEIPKEFRNDFQTFLLGEYSAFTDKLKETLMKMYHPKGGSSGKGGEVKMFDCLYPTTKKKQEIANELGVDYKIIPNEVLSIPKLSDERYYTLGELKEKYNYNSVVA